MELNVQKVLYGKPSNGKKIKIWKIMVYKKGEIATIERVHGYEDAKQTVNQRDVKKGKNIGKSNETTVTQQALNEAKSLYDKQIENDR